MATKKNSNTGEATIVMSITLTSVVKTDVDKLEKAADAEVARINRAIAKLNLDDVAVTQSKTFLKDE